MAPLEDFENSDLYSCGTNLDCYQQTVTTIDNENAISIMFTSDSGVITHGANVSTYFTKTDEDKCGVTYSIVDSSGEALSTDLASLIQLSTNVDKEISGVYEYGVVSVAK